jgi:hypothetical protein
LADNGLLSIKKIYFSQVVAYFFLPHFVTTSLGNLCLKEQFEKQLSL